MKFSIIEDLHINKDSILPERTKTKPISDETVTLALAKTYGLLEEKLSGEHSEDPTTSDEYAKGFMGNNARNVIIEYIFKKTICIMYS